MHEEAGREQSRRAEAAAGSRSEKARRAASAIAAGSAPDSQDYLALRADLISVVRRASAYSFSEAGDIADEAMTRFVEAGKQKRVHRETPLAYVRRIVKNATIDKQRAKHREPATTGTEDLEAIEDRGDDAIARMVSAHDSAKAVEKLLKNAADKEEFTTTKVLNAYLTLAQNRNQSPSSRQVALVAGVSHVTVQAVLRQLRADVDGSTRG